MTNERWKFVNGSEDEQLTAEEKDQGYHFCWDFDGLLVGPDCGEWSCCNCHPKSKREAIARKYPELQPPGRE